MGGASPGYLRCIYCGHDMQDEKTIGFYNMKRDGTIHLSGRLGRYGTMCQPSKYQIATEREEGEEKEE